MSKAVIVTVGGAVEDEAKPEIKAEYGVECSVLRNDTACKNTQWHVEFHVVVSFCVDFTLNCLDSTPTFKVLSLSRRRKLWNIMKSRQTLGKVS